MRNPRFQRLAVCALALACLPTLADDKVAPDKRLTDALDAEDINYTAQDSGEVSVTIQWSDDGRSQAVRIQSTTRRWKESEYRDVYSMAYTVKGADSIDATLARRLLEEGNTFPLGFWALQGDTVFSIARVPANASPRQLHDAIGFVAQYADELEKELAGNDEY